MLVDSSTYRPLLEHVLAEVAAGAAAALLVVLAGDLKVKKGFVSFGTVFNAFLISCYPDVLLEEASILR